MYNIELKKILLVIIILLGAILRTFVIGQYPIHLSHDEISQLYDAISIVETGKDIYGNFMPTIFESVHDFKSPFYTYATAFTYLIFGDSEEIIRFPGVLFGILIIPAIYLFTFQLFGNWKLSLLSAFLVAISPSELFFSRKSFENGAGIFFMLMGFSSLLYYFKLNNQKARWLYIGMILLSAGMYTYFSHAIIIPLLLITFILIFSKSLLNPIKIFFKPILIWLILIVPLLLIVFLNEGSRYRSQTVFITQDIALGKLISLNQTGNLIPDLFFKYKSIFDFSFTRYISQLDPMYLFGNGLDFTHQGPINIAPIFLIFAPFLILGFIFLIRNYPKDKVIFLFSLMLIGLIPSGVTFEPHSPHRVVMVFTLLNIVIAVGIYYSLIHLRKWETIYNFFLFSLIGGISLNLIYFGHMYFINFPFEKSESINYPFKQVANFMWSEYGNYEKLVFDPLFGKVAPGVGAGAHYYLAYYGHLNPAKFQSEYRLGEKPREVIFDKFSIRKVEWREDQNLKNTLIVASNWSLPIDSIEKEKIVKVFYHFDGTPAFYAIKL